MPIKLYMLTIPKYIFSPYIFCTDYFKTIILTQWWCQRSFRKFKVDQWSTPYMYFSKPIHSAYCVRKTVIIKKTAHSFSPNVCQFS